MIFFYIPFNEIDAFTGIISLYAFHETLIYNKAVNVKDVVFRSHMCKMLMSRIEFAT